MKASANNVYMALLVASLGVMFVSVSTAPMDPEDEQSENALVAHPDNDMDLSGPWDSITPAALRKLLMQLDAEDRMGRVTRSWGQSSPRGWGVRSVDGQLARQWRTDKRQVRFRQCYFNPISCFRK